MNLYQILGILSNSTQEQIKHRYKILAQQFHPDKNSGDEEKFKQIKFAYEILIDPDKRNHYDSTGEFNGEISIRTEALNKLSEIINQIIVQVNPNTENLILKLKLEIGIIKRTVKQDIQSCTNIITNLNLIIDNIRLINAIGDDILGSIMQTQLQYKLNDLSEFNRRLEICNIMEDILENYY